MPVSQVRSGEATTYSGIVSISPGCANSRSRLSCRRLSPSSPAAAVPLPVWPRTSALRLNRQPRPQTTGSLLDLIAAPHSLAGEWAPGIPGWRSAPRRERRSSVAVAQQQPVHPAEGVRRPNQVMRVVTARCGFPATRISSLHHDEMKLYCWHENHDRPPGRSSRSGGGDRQGYPSVAESGCCRADPPGARVGQRRRDRHKRPHRPPRRAPRHNDHQRGRAAA